MSPQKMYSYTLYTPSGKSITGEPRRKMTLPELQEAVGGHIELVPKAYYRHHKWGRCNVFVNETARLEHPDAKANPFFKDLGDGFYIIGDALKEEVYKP